MKNFYYADAPQEKFEGADYRDLNNGEWQLLRPVGYRKQITQRDGTHTIYAWVCNAGATTDFFSIPKLARWVLPKVQKRGNIASLFHDDILQSGKPRAFADALFMHAMRDSGMGKMRYVLIHAGVVGYTRSVNLFRLVTGTGAKI